jgi:plasmid stabilization system protein ParE
MRRRHVLLAAADQEIDDQVIWYAQHAGSRVANRFYAELKSTIAQLLRRPRRERPFMTARPGLAGVRIWPLKHFPFPDLLPRNGSRHRVPAHRARCA